MPTHYPHRNAIHNTSHGTACHRCIAPPPPPPPSLSPSPPPSPSPSPPSHSSCAATAPYGQSTKNRRKKPLPKSWWRGFHRSLATAVSARHLTSIVPLHFLALGRPEAAAPSTRTDGRIYSSRDKLPPSHIRIPTHPPPMSTYRHRNAIHDTSHRTARHHSVTGRRHHHHHHHRHPTPTPQPHHTASQRRTSKKIIAKEVGCGAFRGRWSSAIGDDTTLLGFRPHY